MKKRNFFRSRNGKIPLPVFFPDATAAVIRTLDSLDIKGTQTPGVLVNTYHLYEKLGSRVLKKLGGIRKFMNWDGAVISDSGGFQVMSLAKKNKKQSHIDDDGVEFRVSKKKKVKLTPEISIRFQMTLAPDMVVVLDDFTPPGADYQQAEETVKRTLLWAKRSKFEFEKICKEKGLSEDKRPYILGVVQGGDYQELRRNCAEELIKIGFDGLGFGGWPIKSTGKFDYQMSKFIADLAPNDYFLYGLGIGKPEEIASLVNMGYNILTVYFPHATLDTSAFTSIMPIQLIKSM